MILITNIMIVTVKKLIISMFKIKNSCGKIDKGASFEKEVLSSV